MPEIVVAAGRRSQSGKTSNRRRHRDGKIAGVVYGTHEAIAVAVSPKEISAILHSAKGENTLFDIDIQGAKRKVILKEYQVEPLKGALLHADFYEIALDQTLLVKVHVELTGTRVGVKVDGGILDLVAVELGVECLARDLTDK